MNLALPVYRALRAQVPLDLAREALSRAKGLDVAGLDELFREFIDDSAQSWLLSGTLRNAIADCVATQTDARLVLRELTKVDRRLGVWCGAAVAETALRFVPAGEARPRAAIETARAWVHGLATANDCRRASDVARAADAAAYADAASVWNTAFEQRLRDLCVVVADAIRVYPIGLAPGGAA